MRFTPRLLSPLAVLLAAGLASSQPAPPPTAPDAAKVEFFEKKVRPKCPGRPRSAC